MNILLQILISLGTLWGVYNFVPIHVIDELSFSHPINYGSTITTILGTDTLSSSRSVINTNFSNLNTDKIEATVTTLNSLTSATSLATLAALSSIGTITTGTWNGTTIGVAYGGTGSTTLSAFHILLGSTTNAVGIVSGLGTSGQLLTSQGSGLPPQWTSSSFDTTASYTLTGQWTWNTATSTFNATTSISAATNTAPLILNHTPFSFVQGASNNLTFSASSTTWTNDGLGNVAMREPDFDLVAETVYTGAAGTTTISIPSYAQNRKDYMIKVFATSTSASGFGMIINGDSGTNYLVNQGNAQSGAVSEADTASRTGINMENASQTRYKYFTVNVTGYPSTGVGTIKLVHWTGMGFINTTSLVYYFGAGTWNDSSSAITSFAFGGQGVNFAAGTRFSVYASSN